MNSRPHPRPANIWAIGRNYGAHAKELGNPLPEELVVFLKAGSCLQPAGETLEFDAWLADIHHEVELGLLLNGSLEVDAAVIALDFTERTEQNRLKKAGLPWTLAKSFTGACAVSAPFPLPRLSDAKALELNLWVNGDLRQRGSVSDMIFSCERILSFLKARFPLRPGDLILTGTPSGVGPVRDGDLLEAEIPGHQRSSWRIHFRSNPTREA